MPKNRRQLAAIAAIGVIAVAGGCGGGSALFLGKEIKDPDQFLATVEQRWRDDMNATRVTRHAQARCYFAVPDISKDVDDHVYCGPVRHHVDEAGSRSFGDDAWDTYEFEGIAIGGGYELDGPRLDDAGVSIPSGVVLFRPDGQESPE